MKCVSRFVSLALLLCANAVFAQHAALCSELLADSNDHWSCDNSGAAWGLAPDSVALLSTKVLHSSRPAKKILALLPKESAAYEESIRQIMAEFYAKGLPAEVVYLNYAQNEAIAAQSLRSAEQRHFDLVLSMGSQATQYISDNYRHGLPVVTVCSKDPVGLGQVSADGGSDGNIAFTSLNIDVDTQVSYIKQKFLTDLKKIAVIYDVGNVSSVQTQVRPMQDYLKDKDVQFLPLMVDLTNEANRKDPQYLRSHLYSPIRRIAADAKNAGDTVFLVTGSTELFDNIAGINQAAGDVPVLSVTPSHVKAGAESVFMAIGVSFKNNAKLAADYAWRVLNGSVAPGALPVGIVSTPDISINFLHAPRGGIRVPFYFFENAGFIYNHEGNAVRCNGKNRPAAEDCR